MQVAVRPLLRAYLYIVPTSGVHHLRVSQDQFKDETLKEKLHRMGSPARWDPDTWTWDCPLTAAAVVYLSRVAEESNVDVEWDSALKDFANAQMAVEKYEQQVRLSIEKLMRSNEELPDFPTNTYVPNQAGQIVHKPPLRHQKVAYHWALRVTGLMLAHDPGLGKTKSGCDAIGGWYRENIIRPMVQRWSPQHGRWVTDGGVLIVCPQGMMRTWAEELRLWQGATGVEIAGNTRRIKEFKAGQIAHAHTVNYESLDVVKGNTYDAVVMDECFVAKTLVWTEQGPVPIEDVPVGARVWSFNHALQKPELKTVTHAFANTPKGALLNVKTTDGEFVCTEGHPFFTQRGYIRAIDLVEDDLIQIGYEEEKEVSTSNSGVRSRARLRSVQNNVCFSEQVSAENYVQSGMQNDDSNEEAHDVQSEVCICQDEREESNADSWNAGKDICYSQAQWALPADARRKWTPSNQGGDEAVSGFTQSVETMDAESHRSHRRGLSSNSLQIGSCTPRSNDRRGGGWEFSQHHARALSRQAQKRMVAWARVDRVAIHQPDGGDIVTGGSTDRERKVYNLEVTDNNNYYVGSVPHLVHNCHYCANRSDRTLNVLELTANCKRKLGLTGTPISNNLESIFYQMLILDGGRSLGVNKTAFLEKYFTTDVVGKGQRKNTPKQNALQEISAAMARCTYFLKKEEALDLPPQIHTPMFLPMNPEQERYYKKMRDDSIAYIQDSSVTVDQAAARMMKLRQICQGHVLDDNGKVLEFNSIKVDTLSERLATKFFGRKTVVWMSFTYEIERLCTRLQQQGIGYVRLDGHVTKTQRDAGLRLWNHDPRVTVLVGQIKVGIGITLHAGECEVPCFDCEYLSFDHSFTNWKQSRDRIHRIGQVYPCNYTYYICEGSVDHAIYKALLSKESTANAVHKFGKDFFLSLLRDDTPSLAAVA